MLTALQIVRLVSSHESGHVCWHVIKLELTPKPFPRWDFSGTQPCTTQTVGSIMLEGFESHFFIHSFYTAGLAGLYDRGEYSVVKHYTALNPISFLGLASILHSYISDKIVASSCAVAPHI